MICVTYHINQNWDSNGYFFHFLKDLSSVQSIIQKTRHETPGFENLEIERQRDLEVFCETYKLPDGSAVKFWPLLIRVHQECEKLKAAQESKYQQHISKIQGVSLEVYAAADPEILDTRLNVLFPKASKDGEDYETFEAWHVNTSYQYVAGKAYFRLRVKNRNPDFPFVLAFLTWCEAHDIACELLTLKEFRDLTPLPGEGS